MRTRFFPALTSVLVVTTLSACDTPKPFKGTLTELVPTVRPSGSIICIAPIRDIPKTVSDSLSNALADELIDREYLAIPRSDCSKDEFWIRSAPQSTPAEKTKQGTTYVWTAAASPSLQHSLTINPQDTPYSEQTLKKLAKDIADHLGYPPPKQSSVRSPYDLPDGTNALLRAKTKLTSEANPSQNEAKAKDKQQTKDAPIRVYVKLGKGANGEGNLLLRYSMLGYLRRAGYEVTLDANDKAPYQIQAITTVSEPRIIRGKNKGETQVQNVKIVWKITDLSGKRLGEMELVNDLPAGLLPKAWRQAADIVAASSLDGIVQVIDQTDWARREAKKQAATP